MTGLLEIIANAGVNKLVEAIELYLQNDKIIVNITTWEFKKNFLVLKAIIWNDRKTTVITNIELDDVKNKNFFIPNQYPIDPYGEFLFVDSSSYLDSLNIYQHYSSDPLGISEKPTTISLVFEVNTNTDLENLELIFRTGLKTTRFKIKDLIAEVPKIQEYMKLRGFDVEKLYDALS